MNITIINDCRDANAAGRQAARAATLLGGTVAFIGVVNDLEASGNIIDALDAIEDQSGVLLVNVAPRNGEAKKWGNGTPFGYFWYKKTLALVSVDGFTLSLVKKLRLVDSINILDIPSATEKLMKAGRVSREQKDRIIKTQFRSYDFLPRIARFILDNKDVDGTKLSIDSIPEAPKALWWIDNFGNCKTTILPEEISHEPGGLVSTKIGELNYFSRLKDVPEGQTALISGSSGLGENRFLEITVQGGNAAKHFNLSVGDVII